MKTDDHMPSFTLRVVSVSACPSHRFSSSKHATQQQPLLGTFFRPPSPWAINCFQLCTLSRSLPVTCSRISSHLQHFASLWLLAFCSSDCSWAFDTSLCDGTAASQQLCLLSGSVAFCVAWCKTYLNAVDCFWQLSNSSRTWNMFEYRGGRHAMTMF